MQSGSFAEERIVNGARPSRRAFLALGAGAAATWFSDRAASGLSKSDSRELTSLTLQEAAARICNSDVSPVELTQACLRRIARYDSRINAFATLNAELALKKASQAEKEIRSGRWRGPLHGIPVALKDNINVAGIQTIAGGASANTRVAMHDAAVIERLDRAGAVFLGTLNMGEADSPSWPVRNPRALEYECGYTSSGPAAAVAGDFCFGALGTDTGGSIRIPASACGVVGLKPTYGLVSNRGAAAGPLDHIGPLCKTVLDTAVLLQSIAGHDPAWADSAHVTVPDYSAALHDRTPLRLGLPSGRYFDELDPEVAQLTSAAIETMGRIGTLTRSPVNVPLHWEILQGTVVEALVASCARRKDQQRCVDQALAKASQSREGMPDLDYRKARVALREARTHAAAIFGGDVDLLVLPTWKRLPMRIDERQETFPQSRQEFMRELWNTLPFNVLGLPAISVPCGYTKDGLPVGIQIVGRPLAEGQVLRLAHLYEQLTTWHLERARLD